MKGYIGKRKSTGFWRSTRQEDAMKELRGEFCPQDCTSECDRNAMEDAETIRKQAEEIDAKEQEIRRLMFEKTQLLLALDIANDELATAREQVRTLREALRWVVNIIHGVGKAGNGPEPLEHGAALTACEAALAATEPKG